MTLNKGEDESRLPPSVKITSSSLQVIEISSDTEDSVRCGSTSKGEHERNALGITLGNDIIELTDSESNSSSDLPDVLSPLVKRRKKLFGGLKRQQLPTEEFVPLYADTSDDDESDKNCILALNDSPSSRKPLRSVPPAKGQDVTRGNPSPGFPNSRATQKSPRKKIGRSGHKAREQAQRQKYAIELFAELNKNVFGGRLPKHTTLEWSKRLLTTAGRAHWHCSREGVHATKIELASKILDCDERIRNTLSHEMCHLACWVIDGQLREGHGPLFKSWAKKVMDRHPDIHVSTRHNYEISYPYEWKCEKCSKIYGRYSKSIRPDECVCGACKAGKLIPQFVERKPTTPKVGRMAVVKPRDSPRSMAGGTRQIENGPAMPQSLPPSTNLNEDVRVPDLVNALRGITIDDGIE